MREKEREREKQPRITHTRTRDLLPPRYSPPILLPVERPPFGTLTKHPPHGAPPSLSPLSAHHPRAFPRGFIDRPQSPAPAILPLRPLENPECSRISPADPSFSFSSLPPLSASLPVPLHSRLLCSLRARAIKLSARGPPPADLPSKLTSTISG